MRNNPYIPNVGQKSEDEQTGGRAHAVEGRNFDLDLAPAGTHDYAIVDAQPSAPGCARPQRGLYFSLRGGTITSRDVKGTGPAHTRTSAQRTGTPLPTSPDAHPLCPVWV